MTLTATVAVRGRTSTRNCFFQTDPIPGGSANAYDYANQDPTNNEDLTGQWSWKKFTHRVTSIAKFGANLANGSTTLGLAVAYGTGNHCGASGHNLQLVCTGGNYGVRGGTTFGNVFVAREGVQRSDISQSLLNHEAGHGNQWAIGGFLFAGAYLADEIFDDAIGASHGCNVFERNAGLRSGGYGGCHF